MGKAERFNRTLRDRITKHQKAFKTLNWVDVLPNIVENYNNTVHSSIDLAPNNVTEEQAEEIRSYDKERRNHVIQNIESFKVGDKVRMLKKKEAFAKGGSTFTKSIYTIHEIDKLALILKDSNGNIVDKRVKPYNVKLVDDIQTAPENESIEKHSNKANKKLNKFVNKQNRVEAFDVVNQDDGQVELPKKLVPEKDKRVEVVKLKVNDRVSSVFNVGKRKITYEGVIKRVYPKTYDVDFDDGQKLRMKKDEVKLIAEYIEIPAKKSIEDHNLFQVGDLVKAVFKLHGVETIYYGTVIKYLPKSANYKVHFTDGDVQYLRENELTKILV